MASSSRLVDLCEQVVDCPHSTPVWTDTGVTVLRSHNIRNGRLDLSNRSFTDEAHYQDRIRRAAPREGDLVFTREAPMGEVAMIPAGLRCCLGQRMVLLRPDQTTVDPRYLLYALQSPQLKYEIGLHDGTGSTVSNLRIPLLESLRIPTPPLSEQRRIANTLGALDDKIELNHRMSQTLESMALALFRSWFVDFGPMRREVPGHVGHSLVGSLDGAIPAGWHVGSVADLAEVTSGSRPEGQLVAPSVGATVPVWGGNGPFAYVNKPLFDGPVLLTGRVGTLGSVFRINSPCWPSDNTLVLTPKRRSALEYLFLQLKELDLASLNRGSTQPLLTQTDLKSQPVLLPPDQILDHFSAIVRPIYEQVDLAEAGSKGLADIRDCLLTWLLSGEAEPTPESNLTDSREAAGKP